MGLFSFLRRRPKEAAPIPATGPPKNPGIAFVPYASQTSSSRLEFESPPVDLYEIYKAYNVDSYVRQAIDKYIELMFKSGWSFTGRNNKAIEYVKRRFAVMSAVMKAPMDALFVEIAENVVKYANAFVLKVRGDSRYLLGVKAVSLDKGRKPVVGYVCVSPLTMEIARDKSGAVKAYRQVIQGINQSVEFKPEDVIHIYYKRESNMAFGVPFVWPVLEDVKLLRQLEENVAKLVYKELFPFVHWTVGKDKEGYEGTDDEVKAVRSEIAQMAEDGIIVTTERHSLKVLGAEGEALDAERYLRYFEQRVFTGLGVSEAQMGRGATASRSAADVMIDEMHDRIKAFQSVLEIFINFYMINELLLEGGFNPILDEKDQVRFKFKEIDLASLMKRENSAIYKFEHNAVTFEEMREELGMETKVDESRLYKNMFPSAFAMSGSTRDTDNRQQPENQYGKKDAATRPQNSFDSGLFEGGG